MLITLALAAIPSALFLERSADGQFPVFDLEGTQGVSVVGEAMGWVDMGVVPGPPAGPVVEASLNASVLRSDTLASGDPVLGLSSAGSAATAVLVGSLALPDLSAGTQAGMGAVGDTDDSPPPRDMQGEPVSVTATWYGSASDGYGWNCPRQCVTASGETFDPGLFTAASRMYELGQRLEVCYGGQCVHVRLNDRCRCLGLDLSRGAFEQLAPLSRGRIEVTVRAVE